MFFLPDTAGNILEVLTSLQYASPNLGDWCVYGCLDLTMIAENAGGAASSAEGCQSAPLINYHSDNSEKLEKSVLSFCLNHQLIWPSSTSPSGATEPWTPPAPEAGYGTQHPGRQMAPFALRSRPSRQAEYSQDIQLEDLSSSQTVSRDGAEGSAMAVPETEALIDVDQMPEIDPIAQTDSGGATAAVTEREEYILTHVVGVPTAAINLLRDVRDFHEKETSKHPPSGESVALLPPDLVSLPPICPGGPAAVAITAAGRKAINDEPDSRLHAIGGPIHVTRCCISLPSMRCSSC